MSDTTPIPPASERELLPCPFCGHDSPEFERMGTSSQSCIVICGNCGARHESGDEYLRSGSSWNTRAALSHPSTPQGWQPIEPLDLNVFAEICHNAHIDFALDKFPSYERAIEHHYIWMLNAINAQRPPEQGGKG